MDRFARVLLLSVLSLLVSSPRFFPFLTFTTSERSRTSKTLHIINMAGARGSAVADHISYPPHCLANASAQNSANPTHTMLRVKNSISSIDLYPPKLEHRKHYIFSTITDPTGSKAWRITFHPPTQVPHALTKMFPTTLRERGSD